MSPRWRWYLFGYLMALPHTLIGLVLALIYRSGSWRWASGCLECVGGTFVENGRTQTRIWGRPGAQTHGWLIIYASESLRTIKTLRAHERTHVVQGFVGGPLYVVAYVWCFLWLFAVGEFKNWRAAYEANPFEKHARAAARRAGAWGTV